VDFEGTTFSLATFVSAFKNHWKAAAVTLLATLALAILAAMFLPKEYRSDAMIFIRLGRETVSLDPTATTGSTISVLESRDNEINSIRDMLYSRGVVEKIVDRIGPEVILGDAELSDERLDENFAPTKDYKDSPRQKAIELVDKDTDIITARKSSVLILVAKAATPELAQRILTEYLDVYQEMHAVAHQTPKSNKFFEEQTRLLRVRWQESMKALQIAQEDAGVVSIDGAKENLKSQINTTQSNLMQVKNSMTAIRAKISKFRSFASKNPLDAPRIRQGYLESTAELTAMIAEQGAIEVQLSELIAQSAKLNRDEVVIGQLKQEVKLAADNFGQYQELYEQTRIEEALHDNKFTNVRVVQEPSFVPKPVGPKRRLLAAAGLVAGFTGAILIALVLELFFTKSTQLMAKKNESTAPDLERQVLENNEFLADPTVTSGGTILDGANG